VRLVEMLMACNVPLEEVSEQTEETALSMAVAYDDVEVRCSVIGSDTRPKLCRCARVFALRLEVTGFGNARLVEMLLARNVPLEEVWEQTRETALNIAVTYDDVEVSSCILGSDYSLRCV
jgi:hypothetical protein